ncbi:MAG TPA: hypothetical protein VH280_25000 [Verrucomicrobiae bacterium]|jgi:type II secretory pathway component GspD/PulD (secretin)|nr:hypothetical protein [Verrucomicrobiae bacterium]
MTSMLLIVALAASLLGTPAGSSGDPGAQPNAANAQKNSDKELVPPGMVNFQGVDINQVLEVYAHLVGKTLLRSGLPSGTVILETDTPLTRAEAIQVLEAVLWLHGVAVIDLPGGKFIKIVPAEQASRQGQTFYAGNPYQLPKLASCVTRVVRSKYLKPSQIVPIIQPFSKSPNGILPINENGILVLWDDVNNVERMAATINLVNSLYQAGNDSAMVSLWRGLDARVASIASHPKTPGKNLKNATASAQ